MEQKKKEKKVTFSEEIDNSISGFALVITFITVGIFLLFNKGYFENQIVANVVQWTFIVLGCLEFGTEVSTATVEESILIIV